MDRQAKEAKKATLRGTLHEMSSEPLPAGGHDSPQPAARPALSARAPRRADTSFEGWTPLAAVQTFYLQRLLEDAQFSPKVNAAMVNTGHLMYEVMEDAAYVTYESGMSVAQGVIDSTTSILGKRPCSGRKNADVEKLRDLSEVALAKLKVLALRERVLVLHDNIGEAQAPTPAVRHQVGELVATIGKLKEAGDTVNPEYEDLVSRLQCAQMPACLSESEYDPNFHEVMSKNFS